jgi:hypothetical protein
MPTDTVSILRALWDRRRLVACAAVVALIAGYVAAFGTSSPLAKKKQGGTASVRLLVDTPSSQVVAVAPAGLDLLNSRANLLASLMVDGVVKDTIAQRAGLRPVQLSGADLSDVSAANPAPSSQSSYLLTTSVLNDTSSGLNGNQLPIIVLGTKAPTTAGAAKLANAAVAALHNYLDSVAATQKVATSHRLRVTSLGGPIATQIAGGPKIALGFGVAVAIFVAGCAIILIVPAIRAEWRRAAEEPTQVAVLPPAASRPALRRASSPEFRRASRAARPHVRPAPDDAEVEARRPEADAS